jgi:tellurite resistance protein TerC
MVIWLWIGFIVFVLVMLALDLGVFNRTAHEIRTREALGWTALCIALALVFNVLVYFMYRYHWLGIGTGEGSRMTGHDAALNFFTGWVVEYSLSLDNIFIIAIIFSYFKVPHKYQHRVLFWGILGALIMRGLMIAAGAALIHRFEWIIYVFGALLIFTAIKMLMTQQDDIEPEKNIFVRCARKLYPVTSDFEGERFFTRIDGMRAVTPLFLVLLVVESTDVLFAVDSIPAIFAITTDPFLVFTSNIFAILGLRSLYFALAGDGKVPPLEVEPGLRTGLRRRKDDPVEALSYRRAGLPRGHCWHPRRRHRGLSRGPRGAEAQASTTQRLVVCEGFDAVVIIAGLRYGPHMAQAFAAHPVLLTTSRPPHLLLFAGLATGAALSRDAGGICILPLWAEAMLQAPLVLLWTISQTKGRARSLPSENGAFESLLTAVVAVIAAVLALSYRSPGVFFTAMTAFIAGQLVLEWLTVLYRRIEARVLEPVGLLGIVAGPWLTLTFAGTFLLSLPLATHSWVPDYRHNFWLHVSNIAFAAVSSACLVGVGIYDLGNDYSLFGQIVIVAMTQLSGMAFAAVGLAIVQPFLLRLIRLRTVLMTTVLLQLAGILLMAGSWSSADAPGMARRLWWGLVHAGSAIWNSGWMLRPDGLSAYLSDSLIFTVVAVLSIVGSLGVPIILDLLGAPRAKPQSAQNVAARPVWRRLPQWEAGASLLLLLLGASLLFLFETPRLVPQRFVPSRPVDFGEGRVSIRDDIGLRARWSTSVFVSATLRSAGLQSIPLSQGAISWPTYCLMLAGMFVGGSAGGVAGGMRLTTWVLLALAIIFGRTSWATPGGAGVRRLLIRAFLRWTLLWLGLNIVAVFILAAVTDGTWYERIFEPVAALNSVGLSTGLSLHLTWAGRLAMIGTMILGRFVPVAFWLGLSLDVTAALRSESTRPSKAI